MGHVGLTPQSVNALGGYRVQGKGAAEAKRVMADALAIEKAGAFSVVLECVPAALSAEITAELKIPTIGIGAGSCGLRRPGARCKRYARAWRPREYAEIR